MFAFGQQAIEHRSRFLSGHVPAVRYVHVFGAARTVTFLRDPIQRAASEYHHFMRHHGYEGDFPSFYRRPQFVNRLSKVLARMPLEAFGFVGLTEDYEVSLELLNSQFDTRIQNSVLNVGREDNSKAYEIPADQLKELKSLNRQDMLLYEHGVKLLEERKRLASKQLPFVHGALQAVNDQSVQGWAWFAGSSEPVELEIQVDGVRVGRVNARELRPGLLPYSPPRNGYVGFQMNFRKPVEDGAKVRAVVVGTEQVVGEMSCKASA